MSRNHLVAAVLAAAIICGIHAADAQQPRRPVVPLAPAELLPLLPAAPPEWKMTESTAKNFFMRWVCAQATREFQRPAPPAAQPGATPAPPLITRVRVTDTGYFPAFNGDFSNFRVGKYSNAESLMLLGLPARRILVDAARERLRLSVRGRFVVDIETQNQPPDSGKAWLQVVDFRRIASLPDTGSTELPKPINIQIVDEIRPANNSTSQLHWGGPAATESE